MASVLGIDVGGTGTKAAIVDTSTGKLLTDRIKIATPQPATPEKLRPVFFGFNFTARV